jgi:PAS domain S-box-containing protein
MSRWKLIWVSLGLGFIYWTADILVDVFIFNKGSLAQQIISPTPPELWMRLFASVIIIVFGIYFQHIVSTRKKASMSLREREELYHALFENANDIIQSIAPDGRFIFANPAWLKTRGYTEEELKELTIFDIIPDDCKGNCTSLFQKVMSGESLTNVQTKFISKNGRLINLEGNVTASVVNGKIVATHGIFHNITEQKIAEEKLKMSLSLHKATIESTTDGILVVDTEGRIASFNQKFLELWSIPDSVIASRDDNQALNFVLQQLKDPSGFISKVRELYSRPETESFDTLEFRDGRIFERYSKPQKIDENAVGRVWSFRDVTEQKRTEQKLRAYARQQTTIAKLGQRGLEGIEHSTLMDEAVNLVAQTLEVEYCKILELLPGGNALLLRAGVGWKDGLVGQATVPAGSASQAGYTLLSNEPVIVEDVSTEKRFAPPSLLRDHGVVSGISVIIGHLERPFGILGAHTGRRRTFTEDDIQFLESIANLLASAIEHKKMEEKLFQISHDWQDTFNSITDMVTVHDKDFNIIHANKAAERILGLPLIKDLAGTKCFRFYHGTEMPPEGCPSCSCLKTGESATFEIFEPHLNMDIEIRAIPRFDSSHNMIGLVHVVRDITERKKLESQLQQSQKMEAVGTLTGGIAHDFNNILTAIIGYGNILKMKLEKESPLLGYTDQILASADRAAHLTQSLLAFSRKQVINPKPVNLNEITASIEKILLRIIGEDIELMTVLSGMRDLRIMADAGQIEQVLMNLATNARDAMPEGGTLTIETGLEELDMDFLKIHEHGKPGMYAMLTVTDTGHGMDENTRQRIFEPFFTTKEVGKGTGLGLSMVYGIIKQHNGYINCYSEPGAGTTFKIYLPVIESETEKAKKEEHITLSGGTETILLAEDEEAVRKLMKLVLEEAGYKVIEAVDGQEAIEKFRENKDNISLLLLDVIMPKINGKGVYEKATKIKPDIKALFSSGYPADFIHKKGILEEGLNFISKPASPHELLKRIREAIDK